MKLSLYKINMAYENVDVVVCVKRVKKTDKSSRIAQSETQKPKSKKPLITLQF